MLIKHSNKTVKEAPNSLSDYERTHNNAIDIVTEAVGWANKVSTKMVAAIILKPTKFRLFKEGLRLLMEYHGQPFTDVAEYTFEGYRIMEGSRGQSESVLFEYVENSINNKIVVRGQA